MKPVLILQHQVPENAAYLTTWLNRNGIAFEVRNAGDGEEFPDTIEPYSALAVMGGGMSANDPLLSSRQAEILILQAIHRDIPVVGHCLGGQLMSRALGATVQASPQPEVGWQPIAYEDTPLVKEWFGDAPTPTVIQWHYDSFSIPTGATLLAGSESCPNQAFSIGKHLAMQFHIEIDEEKIFYWVSEDDEKWATARDAHKSVHEKFEILSGVGPNLIHHQKTADNIYSNWLKDVIT